ncbi:MAG: multicopper oxidase domain-containing protein [Chloroflexota bacterium]
MRPVRLMTRLPRLQRLVLGTLGLVPAALIGALAVPALAAAAGPVTTAASCTGASPAITCNLWAEVGSVPVPGGSVAAAARLLPRPAASDGPGPAIVATAGDTITLNLVNHLPQPTSLVVRGLNGAPDIVGREQRLARCTPSRRPAPGRTCTRPGSCPAASTRSRWACTACSSCRRAAPRARPVRGHDHGVQRRRP